MEPSQDLLVDARPRVRFSLVLESLHANLPDSSVPERSELTKRMLMTHGSRVSTQGLRTLV